MNNKIFLGFMGFLSGLGIMLFVCMTQTYKEYAYGYPNLNTNKGLMLLVSAGLGASIALGPFMIDKIGLYGGMAIIGILAYACIDFFPINEAPATGIMFLVSVGAFFATIFRGDFITNGTPHRLMTDD